MRLMPSCRSIAVGKAAWFGAALVLLAAADSFGEDAAVGKRFWSFQPPQRHTSPTVRYAEWSRQPIDPFILAKIEEAGLKPNPPADRRTWLRRVSFDLVGLPPTPTEVAEFVADASPDAFEKAVERLLDSPHFGERWARVWLDVVRYAEDQAHIVGTDESLFYPNAYLYRDWVIRAINEDMPYHRFVQLQLAADLMEPDDTTNLAALGFIGLGPKYYGRKSQAVMADEWEDRVDVVGRGLMGLTLACARCHDHKFDPVGTVDYYALAGVFASTSMFNRPLDDGREKKDDGEAKQPKDSMHIVREGTATDLNVFIRGDVENKGPTVPRRFLPVLCDAEPPPFQQGSGRLELARAITDAKNPLTARVIVNRIWSNYFGRGLVETPSNFGSLGERPSHPELLDDLAARFIESGWSLKWLHREIAMSATYRQNGRADVVKLTADPDNRLLGRMPRRRLSVEAWRDAILFVNGRLDTTVGGPSIDPLDPGQRRRTVYSRASRLELNRMLAMFDYPDPNVHADRRVETTTPLQKMFVMNSPFMVAQAESLVERLNREIACDDQQANGQRIERAYQLLYGRSPTDAERQLAVNYLQDGGDRIERWSEYAHALLAANELLFVD